MTETRIDDLIWGYSAGRLPGAVHFLMDVHFQLSPSSARMAAIGDSVGGRLLETADGASGGVDVKSNVFALLDESPSSEFAPIAEDIDADLPPCLRSRIGSAVSDIEWKEFSGIGEHTLSSGDRDGYMTKLIRVRAGRSVPQHTHEGDELTLILRGAFTDSTGRYARGDLSIANDSVDHRPVADPFEDCLCLAVTNAPIKLSGAFTKFLNPFLRF